MLNVLFIGFSWLLMGVLTLYFKLNINVVGLDGGVGLSVLILAFGLGGILTLWRALVVRNVYIRYSSMLLMLFYSYFVFRIGIDIGNVERLKAMTIATSGGTLFAYCLGIIVSIVLHAVMSLSLRSRFKMKISIFGVFLFLIFSTLSMCDVFFNFVGRLRSNIFLLGDLNGAYQRPGDFLSLCFLMVSVSYMCVMLINKNKKIFIYTILQPFIIVIYLFFSLVSIIIAQMMGSNKGLFLIIAILLITCMFFIFDCFPKFLYLLANFPLRLRSLFFGYNSRVIIKSGVLAILAISLVLFVAVTYIGIDVSKTRVMNFGHGGATTSLTSRIQIAKKYFWTNFDNSPFGGNMNVDLESAGKTGDYIHSVLAYLLTHTGLLGTFLFFMHITMAVRELFSCRLFAPGDIDLYSENGLKLYGWLIFFIVLMFAMVGTIITWMPLWFAMGLFLTPLVIKRKCDYSVKQSIKTEKTIDMVFYEFL